MSGHAKQFQGERGTTRPEMHPRAQERSACICSWAPYLHGRSSTRSCQWGLKRQRCGAPVALYSAVQHYFWHRRIVGAWASRRINLAFQARVLTEVHSWARWLTPMGKWTDSQSSCGYLSIAATWHYKCPHRAKSQRRRRRAVAELGRVGLHSCLWLESGPQICCSTLRSFVGGGASCDLANRGWGSSNRRRFKSSRGALQWRARPWSWREQMASLHPGWSNYSWSVATQWEELFAAQVGWHPSILLLVIYAFGFVFLQSSRAFCSCRLQYRHMDVNGEGFLT